MEYQLAEEIKLHEREVSKAAAMKVPPELIILDKDFLNARARGKALRSGKRLPDVLEPCQGSRAPRFVDDENAMDNISISDSEEDDGFNHWSSNEGRYR